MSTTDLKSKLKSLGLKTSGSKKDLENRLKEYNSLPSKIDDKVLYLKVRDRVKKRVKTWPSAYASGQVVSEYKREGGTYSGKKEGDLDRWYKEKWVNVCKPKGRGYEPCGRQESNVRKYPYCRPSKRVSDKTPKTVSELGKKKLEEMCKKKKSPKKVYVSTLK